MLGGLHRWGVLFDRLGVVRFRVVNVCCWIMSLVFGMVATLITVASDEFGDTQFLLAVFFFTMRALVQGLAFSGGAPGVEPRPSPFCPRPGSRNLHGDPRISHGHARTDRPAGRHVALADVPGNRLAGVVGVGSGNQPVLGQFGNLRIDGPPGETFRQPPAVRRRRRTNLRCSSDFYCDCARFKAGLRPATWPCRTPEAYTAIGGSSTSKT